MDGRRMEVEEEQGTRTTYFHYEAFNHVIIPIPILAYDDACTTIDHDDDDDDDGRSQQPSDQQQDTIG